MKVAFIGLLVALWASMLVVTWYQICKVDSVGIDELRDSGYEVVRHSETHGDFSTTWVEIVRTDGRPL